MAYFDGEGDGVHPPIPSTHLAEWLSACALLRLAGRSRPDPMGAHLGAAGLDCSTPPSPHSQASTALSSLRRPAVLESHADPWPSLTPTHALSFSPQAQFGRPAKTRANANPRFLPQGQEPLSFSPKARHDRVCFWPKLTTPGSSRPLPQSFIRSRQPTLVKSVAPEPLFISPQPKANRKEAHRGSTGLVQRCIASTLRTRAATF